GGDRDGVLAVMQTYYAHALAWADHLESQEARQSQEPRGS
ncbi:GntR family transcriptional regulator, partial [Streptomyces sp. SID8455]|nr:GntR family transcriptional regulator [Streptomyces sp. SID8455]